MRRVQLLKSHSSAGHVSTPTHRSRHVFLSAYLLLSLLDLLPLCPSACRSASSGLSINTNHSINVKAEPVSPPRDHLSQSAYVKQAHGPPPHHTSSSSRAELGRSPADSISSSCSSHEGGSDREDLHVLPASRSESPTLKRMRMDSWVT